MNIIEDRHGGFASMVFAKPLVAKQNGKPECRAAKSTQGDFDRVSEIISTGDYDPSYT